MADDNIICNVSQITNWHHEVVYDMTEYLWSLANT